MGSNLSVEQLRQRCQVFDCFPHECLPYQYIGINGKKFISDEYVSKKRGQLFFSTGNENLYHKVIENIEEISGYSLNKISLIIFFSRETLEKNLEKELKCTPEILFFNSTGFVVVIYKNLKKIKFEKRGTLSDAIMLFSTPECVYDTMIKN